MLMLRLYIRRSALGVRRSALGVRRSVIAQFAIPFRIPH
jgi:hypothetical protein